MTATIRVPTKLEADLRARLDTPGVDLPVLTEATFVLRFSVDAQRDLLWWAHRSFGIDQGTASDLPSVIALLENYRDMPADFADVSIVAMAEQMAVPPGACAIDFPEDNQKQGGTPWHDHGSHFSAQPA